jgi:hypothetical protein
LCIKLNGTPLGYIVFSLDGSFGGGATKYDRKAACGGVLTSIGTSISD